MRQGYKKRKGRHLRCSSSAWHGAGLPRPLTLDSFCISVHGIVFVCFVFAHRIRFFFFFFYGFLVLFSSRDNETMFCMFAVTAYCFP